MECFLCEKGMCYLGSVACGDFYGVYCSINPDLDENCGKPLHVMVAPMSHASISDMSDRRYCSFMLAVRKVQRFFLQRGYGPKVTVFRLDPGAHTDHPHEHLVFSSDPLFPLKKRKGVRVEDDFLNNLKKEFLEYF